ncbi:hypothetical protein [Pseudomonas rubra]|uniref:DUF1444 family protein n=1 Tax=Pseudomonas rubra TaxID=2942627 RepID=A0ABT5PAZ5_9PSED|nr:hypothetical protein [Pseudomonas rubra]MDD1015485.1 hypothetical protein [Pseudomonas rubra]MDD1041299.1 hypothetical protein [Pseudomonas rubra]MDD1157136.1 hypothetical protein [Pseudomonas rubra]
MFKALFARLFNRTPTEDEFAQTFIKAARAGGYAEPLEYLAGEFRLRYDESGYFNLHNAYRDYLNAEKSRRTEVLGSYLRALIDTRTTSVPQTLEQVRPLLRPVIRNLAMLEEVRLHHVRSEGWDSPCPLAWQPFSEDCVTLLAVDYPDTTSTQTTGPHKDWGISLEQALAIALDNLRDASPDAFEPILPGVYQGAWKDGYDTSRVLLPDVLQRLPLKGQPVFMMPSRDVLMVTGDNDAEGLRQMVELSFHALENGRAQSSQIYTYQDRQIVPFQVQDANLQARLGDLQRLLRHGIYSSQKEFLEQIHEAHPEDIFIATHKLYGNGDHHGSSFSIAAWTQGVPTSLPKTDRVIFVQPQQDGTAITQVVAWPEVESLLADLLAPDGDLYPPRYRTLGFPGTEQLARMTPMD